MTKSAINLNERKGITYRWDTQARMSRCGSGEKAAGKKKKSKNARYVFYISDDVTDVVPNVLFTYVIAVRASLSGASGLLKLSSSSLKRHSERLGRSLPGS